MFSLERADAEELSGESVEDDQSNTSNSAPGTLTAWLE